VLAVFFDNLGRNKRLGSSGEASWQQVADPNEFRDVSLRHRRRT
jgi:hypothetical protein